MLNSLWGHKSSFSRFKYADAGEHRSVCLKRPPKSSNLASLLLNECYPAMYLLTYLLTGNRFLSNINWEIQVQHSYWCCWIDSNTEDSFFLFVLEHLHSQTICHSSLTVILPNCVILVTFSSPQIQKKSRPGKFSDACANHTLCDGKSHGTKVTALVVTLLFLGLFCMCVGVF